jgi:protein-tyrosine phosphatase
MPLSTPSATEAATSVLFVCHGNICRSTMAEFVMKHLVGEAGRAGEFYIDSAATSREEIGNDVHPGTRRKLREVGIACGHHASRQMGPADYARFDYIVGMDEENMAGMYRLLSGEKGFGWGWDAVSAAEAAKADPDGKVSKLLAWAGISRDVADPWYTGNFDATYDDVLLGCRAMLEQI